ncbi:MAG: DUF6894 family protein [Allorhizobium sp.]|uniref:DUF6894 family protein n=1 Tax=Allorhizobium sp. TaxID=633478 RepID=UPI00403429B2
MARYFFNIRSAGRVELDNVGADFDDDVAAKLEAVEAAKDMIEDALAGDGDVGSQAIEIVTAGEDWVATLPLKAVLDPLELRRRLSSRGGAPKDASDAPESTSW